MQFIEVFVIFVMSVALFMYLHRTYGEVDIVVSSVDKRRYVVQQLPDKAAAADLLASINGDLLTLIAHMVKKYGDRADVRFMKENYNPAALSEGSAKSGYTSYSLQKGERVVLCIRQTDDSFVKKNVLMYVAIHELAHILTHEEVGHTKLFWKNFKWLLEEAIGLGLYVKQDFEAKPEQYCSIVIQSSII
jgi:predicted metal-dependent hydrolase